MWILFLFLQINFNIHSEYWLYSDSLSEHFESFGSLLLREKVFSLSSDYLIEDNIFNTHRKYLLFPLLTLNTKNLEIGIGYFQKNLLSGILLNQTHDIQFKRFRYIKGLSIIARHRNASLSAISGTPHDLQFDGMAYTPIQDTASILRGISLSMGHGSVDFSAGYIRLNRKNMPAPYAFSEIGGGEIVMNSKKISVSMDFALKRGVDFITYTRKKGSAVFVSVEFMPAKFNFLLQLARYDSIEFYNLNLPPVPLKTEILPSGGNSDKGGSFTLFIPFSRGNIEIGSGGLFDIQETNYINPDVNRAFQEFYLQTDIYSTDISYSIKSGYEHRLRVEPEYTHLKNLYIQSDLDISPLSIEIFSRIDRFKEDSINYFKTTFNSTVYLSERFNIQFLFEYATRKIPRYNFENLWPGIEVSWDINGGNISLFYGKQRGGLVCSGGMCRITPRFNGLKLTFQKSI